MNYLYSENPPEFRRDAWYGLIFRWYGIDKLGDIAIFETGELPIPKAVFTNEVDYKELEMYFRQLPQITTSQITGKMSKLKTASGKTLGFSDDLSTSNCGLYFIDEVDTFLDQEYLYGYYLLAVPNKKLNINVLPEKIQHLLSPYQFPIVFSDIEKVDVTKYFNCD